MSHFSFVNGDALNICQVSQLTELLSANRFINLISQDNIMGWSTTEFIKQVIISIYENHTCAMLDENQHVVGFYIATTRPEMLELYKKIPPICCATPDNLLYLKKFNKFMFEETHPDDLIVHFIALNENLKGKEYYQLLLSNLVLLAKKRFCSQLFSLHWETHRHTLKMLKYYGSQEIAAFDFKKTKFKDTLVNLTTDVNELEKTLKSSSLRKGLLPKRRVAITGRSRQMHHLTRLYFETAKKLKLNCEFDPIYNGLVVKMAKKRYYFRDGASPFDDFVSADIAGNKYFVNTILRDAGFPVPEAVMISKYHNINNQWVLPYLEYPVVAKPTVSRYGDGLDVYCNITSQEVLIPYLDEISQRHPFISIEKFEANLSTYRVTVFYNKVIAVARRDPATVTGDGVHTLSELIARENKMRIDAKSFIPPDEITLGREHRQKLQEMDINPDSILVKGQRITLCYASSALHGESIVSLGAAICPENAKLICDAAKVLNLNLAGFDIICEDINIPISQSRGFIIEVNFNPDISIHQYPSQGPSVPVAQIILSKLIKMHPFRYVWSRVGSSIQSLREVVTIGV